MLIFETHKCTPNKISKLIGQIMIYPKILRCYQFAIIEKLHLLGIINIDWNIILTQLLVFSYHSLPEFIDPVKSTCIIADGDRFNDIFWNNFMIFTNLYHVVMFDGSFFYISPIG